MIAYVLLCPASLLAGLGVMSFVRLELRESRTLLVAPALTLSVWAVVLGVGVSLGATVRQVAPVFWALTAVLSVRGALAVRRTVSRDDLLVVCWAVALPMAFLAADALHGLTNYVGSPGGDGWSYVAFGQYLWEVPKTTSGQLAPLWQYASHLKGTRFIASGLLGAFSPLNGMPGDTQAAVGAFLAWSLFTLALSCAAVIETIGLRGPWRLLAMTLAVVSPWVLGALQMHNYDNLIALSFLPTIMALSADAPRAGRRVGVVCGLLLGATLYTYPELAAVVFGGAALTLAVLVVRFGGGPIWLGGAVAAGLAAVLVFPGRADLIPFLSSQIHGAGAVGGRPGENGFLELLAPANWPAVAFGLAPIQRATHPSLAETWAGQVTAVCAGALILAGYAQLIRLRRWDVAGVGLLLLAGVAEMVIREQYGYGAYKLLLFGWWIHSAAGVLAARAVFTWLGRTRPQVALPASLVLMSLAGLLLAGTAACVVAYRQGLGAPTLAPYRRLVETDRIIGDNSIIIDVYDSLANEWAVYFLREHRLYLMQYGGYMAAPHLVALMGLSAPVDLTQAKFVLSNSRPEGRTVVWSGGPYFLSRLPQSGAALIKSVHNPNGNEELAGRPYYWLGEGDTEIRVISTATGDGLLTADFGRGPSLPERSDRRLLIRVNDGAAQMVTLDAAGERSLAIPLRVGENVVSIRALDEPSQVVPNDPRRLVLGMGAPRFSLSRIVRFSASLLAVPQSDDRVGCGPGAFAPDGKADLQFQLSVDGDSGVDLTRVELLRGGQHAGIWTTSAQHFALGVSTTGTSTLLGGADPTIQSEHYSGTGLQLFACDDGATGPGDTFLARVTLSSGQIIQTSAVTPAVR
jgi:hypothetical protein